MKVAHLARLLAPSLWCAALITSITQAAVIPVSQAAFTGGSTLVTFTDLPEDTEVNGLSVGGLEFSYSLGNGSLIIDAGPGITANIVPPNIVSTGDSTGVLTITLSAPADLFGIGYAILNTIPVVNATTITVFSGATNLGSLSYNAVTDPSFTGGFAGLQSTIPFDRVQVTFDSAAAPAFALDNVRVATTVPEASSLVLVASGIAGLIWRRQRRL
jgi:hypothetical protein